MDIINMSKQKRRRAMNTFLHKHMDKITGVLSCPDRVIFKGHLPLSHPMSMDAFMTRQRWLLKDFKEHGKQASNLLVAHAKKMCAQKGRPYEYLRSFTRKETYAREIAERDGIVKGLVCVFATLESCGSYKLAYGEGRPRLKYNYPRCLVLYYYFMDREYGFMHVRIQTWFPMTVQVYINGREWLGKKLELHGVAYTARDNAIIWVEDPQRAQRFADNFAKRNWPRILDAFAKRVNPLLKNLLADCSYYWVTDQFEYATDIMFNDPHALEGLYKELLEHATLCFSAEDVLTFLGKKLHGNFKGEVLNDRKTRQPGARIKHRVSGNWIKMYDKFGSVLRIETVINRPYDFRVRRTGMREGRNVIGWFPMAKGVANLPRYVDVCLAANKRYIERLAVVDDPGEALDELPKLAKRKHINGNTYRAFNPLNPADIQLFHVLMRGEHAIHGFRNKDIRRHLMGESNSPEQKKRDSAKVSRLFGLLHAHKLIAKIPRSRRWHISKKGQRLMTCAITLYYKNAPKLYANAAA